MISIAACTQGGSYGATLWGVKQDGYSLINTSQIMPGGRWSNWSADNWQGSKPVITITAALQKNGTVRLWATRSAETADLHVAGEVVGTCDGPLDLYLLLDNATVGSWLAIAEIVRGAELVMLPELSVASATMV